MKNIHLIPTDKPTGIFQSNSGLQFSIRDKVRVSPLIGFHLYITNDEEIKEGDWYLNNGNLLKCTEIKKRSSCKKIILTTDVDLIADGVQAIDDEFLEWFVKNPSCEEVEIGSWFNEILSCCRSKEECHCNKKRIIIPQEEPKQELLPDFKITKNIFDFVTNLSDTKKEEPKQETLEETAKGYSERHQDVSGNLGKYLVSAVFQDGAKWQAERMYSEEEVCDILFKLTEFFWGHTERMSLIEWFEQFKKK